MSQTAIEFAVEVWTEPESEEDGREDRIPIRLAISEDGRQLILVRIRDGEQIANIPTSILAAYLQMVDRDKRSMGEVQVGERTLGYDETGETELHLRLGPRDQPGHELIVLPMSKVMLVMANWIMAHAGTR